MAKIYWVLGKYSEHGMDYLLLSYLSLLGMPITVNCFTKMKNLQYKRSSNLAAATLLLHGGAGIPSQTVWLQSYASNTPLHPHVI
jgi:hypothetical protein